MTPQRNQMNVKNRFQCFSNLQVFQVATAKLLSRVGRTSEKVLLLPTHIKAELVKNLITLRFKKK